MPGEFSQSNKRFCLRNCVSTQPDYHGFFSFLASKVEELLWQSFFPFCIVHETCQTLGTYTFLITVFIVGEIKSTMRKVWEIKSRNAIIGVPLWDSCCKVWSCSISEATNFSWDSEHLERSLSLKSSLRTVKTGLSFDQFYNW